MKSFDTHQFIKKSFQQNDIFHSNIRLFFENLSIEEGAAFRYLIK